MIETTIDAFRRRFESREFWILAFDPGARPVLSPIKSRYYLGAGPEDFEEIEFGGFLVASARKKRMLAWQLGSILRQTGQIRLTEREICTRDVLIIAAPKNLLIGAICAAGILARTETETDY